MQTTSFKANIEIKARRNWSIGIILHFTLHFWLLSPFPLPFAFFLGLPIKWIDQNDLTFSQKVQGRGMNRKNVVSFMPGPCEQTISQIGLCVKFADLNWRVRLLGVLEQPSFGIQSRKPRPFFQPFILTAYPPQPFHSCLPPWYCYNSSLLVKVKLILEPRANDSKRLALGWPFLIHSYFASTKVLSLYSVKPLHKTTHLRCLIRSLV